MRLPCPFCGPRDSAEFSYRGDAMLTRPPADDASTEVVAEHVYLRDDPVGPHEELWFHRDGCQAFLVVRRDTRTHEVFGARSLETAR